MLDQLKDLEVRQKCRAVWDALSIDPRKQMPHSEFVKLCALHGLNDNQSLELTKSLHNVGLIWYFDGYFEAKHPLILKTKFVTRKFLETLDLTGEVRDEFVASKQQELEQKMYVLLCFCFLFAIFFYFSVFIFYFCV